ncbi:hypothetical protein ACFQJ7_00430 [Halovenus rubra]|uniref:Uncharacterized protein n=2 Tax=Halovenus rubra TaxID=869890 RepID=A0ACC7E1M6_9EURY|nr:hypothetical protein [Halovenus rubra]
MSVSNSLGRSVTDLAHSDWVLLLIPLVFFGTYLLCFLVVGAQSVALISAALCASLLVVDGLFVRPPTRR